MPPVYAVIHTSWSLQEQTSTGQDDSTPGNNVEIPATTFTNAFLVELL